MGPRKPPGISNTREGKAIILKRTKALVDKSGFIMVFPVQGVSKENIDLLRKDLPEGTTASVVKNAILRIALKGTSFEPLGSQLRDENMFLFCPEGQQKKAYDVYKKWQKEAKRAEDEFNIKYGVLEGQIFSGKGVEDAVAFPTKKELITKIAISIKGIPTKLGRTIKAAPSKVGRAFGALKDKLEKEAQPSS
jgi:large subunit ribosomal protein L10